MDSESAQNMRATAQGVADTLGLDPANRQNWSQQDAVNYITMLRDAILYNPDLFDDATLAIAQNMHVQSDLNVYSTDAARDATAADIAVGVCVFAAGVAALTVGVELLAIPAVAGAIGVGAGIALSNPRAVTALAVAAGVTFYATNSPSQNSDGTPTVAGKMAEAVTVVTNTVRDVGKAIGNVASVLTWALPLAVVIFLYYASKSASKDPAGQASKLIDSSTSGVRKFLPY